MPASYGDPDMPKKYAEDRPEDRRPCLRCNACMNHLMIPKPSTRRSWHAFISEFYPGQGIRPVRQLIEKGEKQMEIRSTEELAPYRFSTGLSNESPYHGLFREEVKTEQGENRELLVYLPEGMRRNEYFVTIALPDGEDTEDYIERSGWLPLADSRRTGLFFLMPQEGKWKSYREEEPYLNAVRMAGGNPFAGSKYSTRRTEYLFGVGEGGTVLEQWAAVHPGNVIAQMYIGAKVSEATLRELSHGICYEDDMSQPAHPESRVRPVFEGVRADRIPVATALYCSPQEVTGAK